MKVRVNRAAYEICALQALREQLRCKEVWVEGADRYRDPDQDLPADFDVRRDAYYAALGLPNDASGFLAAARTAMADALDTLDRGLADNPHVRLVARGSGRITLTPLERQPEPAGLLALKAEIGRRWPMTGLLDMLKEADLRIGCTDALRTVTDHENLPRRVLQARLLLCLNGIGTNAGLKRMASGQEDVTYKDLRYVRRRFLTRDGPREAIARVVNATLRAPPGAVGRGHGGDRGLRCGQQTVRRLGPEPDDRVARPLWRPGRDDLLARRAPQHVHLFATEDLLVVGGRRHDRGRAAPLHRPGGRSHVRRLARAVGRSVCLLPPARLPAPAAAEGDPPPAARPAHHGAARRLPGIAACSRVRSTGP